MVLSVGEGGNGPGPYRTDNNKRVPLLHLNCLLMDSDPKLRVKTVDGQHTITRSVD